MNLCITIIGFVSILECKCIRWQDLKMHFIGFTIVSKLRENTYHQQPVKQPKDLVLSSNPEMSLASRAKISGVFRD